MHHLRQRKIRQALTAMTLSAALITGLTVPAVAEPTPLRELKALARQAERTAEKIHYANDQLKQARRDEKAANSAIKGADHRIGEAVRRRHEMQGSVNNIASINLRNGQQLGIMTVLMSKTPQDILDQSRSEAALTQTTLNVLLDYDDAIAAAKKAKAEAFKNRKKAEAAAVKARAAQAALDKQRIAMRHRVALVREKFASLPPGLRDQWKSVKLPPGFDPHIAFGSNVLGNKALRIAMTRIGAPYVWGATGPDAFDCSGLVYWAYKQLGKILPRSSQGMAASGLVVPMSNIQPGDLVIYYNDASHVGLYAGNGKVLHAPTFGQTVRLSPLHHAPIHSVRRY